MATTEPEPHEQNQEQSCAGMASQTSQCEVKSASKPHVGAAPTGGAMPRARVRKTRPAIFVCSFSGAIGDMKRKDQRDPLKVLAVLRKSPRFSVWDASDNRSIAGTMDDLKTNGLIDFPKPQPGFPWSKARVTEAGIALLDIKP